MEAIRQCAGVALETLDFWVRLFSFYFLCLTVWLLMAIPSDFLPVKYQVQTKVQRQPGTCMFLAEFCLDANYHIFYNYTPKWEPKNPGSSIIPLL